MERLRSNPWLLALVSWAGAVGLVVVLYVVYKSWHHEVVNWILVRNAAGIGALLALLNAFRDWRRSKREE